MKTTKGWGWLAAGVLALGLNGFYHDGGAAWAHRTICLVSDRIAEQTGPVLALASGRADLFMAKTGVAAAQGETVSCRWATAVARMQSSLVRHGSSSQNRWQHRMALAQAGMARFEAMSAREEAAMARVEAARARIEAQVSRVRMDPAAFTPVVCPRARVNASRLDIVVPVVHIEAGAGAF